MSRCDLFLDNYATCYCAGQQIVGRLRCYFNSPKSTSEIHVKIKGMAIVQWSETERRRTGSDNKSHTERVTYRGVHEFFNEKIQLLYQHGNKIEMAEGEHVFPFTYTLPPDLPSTFRTSSVGKITYTIKGNVDQAFQFDFKAETEINVVEVFDLNRCPNLLMPVDMDKQKSMGCLCWRSGLIDMSLNIPYTGFVPGQSVPITLRIENLSRTSITAVTFNIHQDITFYSNTPRRKCRSATNRITDMKDTGVGAHGERTYEHHLQIPSSFTPLNLKICSIIDVVYTLNIAVVIPGMHRNMKETVLIEIGNVASADSGYRVQQQYAPVLSLVEPEIDIAGDTDGFVIVGPNVSPSAPPAMPPYMDTGLVQPTFPALGGNGDMQPDIGWRNPTADATGDPPSYNELFEKKL